MTATRRLVKLARLLRRRSYRRALFYGVAASIEHTPILRQLSCRTVVDVGANKGQFALAALAACPNTKLYSFEPLDAPAHIFARVLGHERGVTLIKTAIGRRTGEVEMHVSRREDSSSLLPITARQCDIFPGTEEQETRTVSVKRLDEVLTVNDIEKPALLKIDVQGFEGEVLKGCESLLGCFTYFYIECSFEELYEGQALASEVIDYLRRAGLTLKGVYNLSYDRNGKAIQGDFFFIRNGE